MVGALRSTFTWATGSTEVQFPATTNTVGPSVAASADSVPTGTEVVSLKLACDGSTSPPSASDAVQVTPLSVRCQAVSGEPHATVGAWVSAPGTGVTDASSVRCPSAAT